MIRRDELVELLLDTPGVHKRAESHDERARVERTRVDIALIGEERGGIEHENLLMCTANASLNAKSSESYSSAD